MLHGQNWGPRLQLGMLPSIAHSDTTHVLTKLPGGYLQRSILILLPCGLYWTLSSRREDGDWAAASVRVSHPRRS